MAISLVRRLEPWWFTPDSQKNEPEPSRFLLGPLPRQAMLEIAILFGEESSAAEHAEGHRLAARAGILGWENVYGADGLPTPFRPDAIMDLPTQTLVDIGREVAVRNLMSEQEAKNSGSPSTSSNTPDSSSADDASADGARTASGGTPSRNAGPSKVSA